MALRSVFERGPLVAAAVACGALLWASCAGSDDDPATDDTALPGDGADTETTTGDGADDAASDAIEEATASNPCATATPVMLEATLPTSFGGSQLDADCIAWQQFIYLNWAADPAKPGYPAPNASASSFGTPGDTSATVWESYLEADQVFGEGDAEAVADWSTERADVKELGRLSKVAQTDLELSAIAQAGDNKWLTDQRGNLVFYEVKINEDEHDYIHSNGLTTSAGQASCATMTAGLDLPIGSSKDTDCAGNPVTYGQDVGAIELKAAWVELPSDGSLDHRYKTAVADLSLPDGTTKAGVTVGLVGLHIIHKMEGAEQFIWTTFEHIDNTPDDNGGSPEPPDLPANPNVDGGPPPYTFYNPDCESADDKVYGCTVNSLPGDPCTSPGTPVGCFPYSAPMQITRYFAVQTTANNVNAYAWSLLPADSVFNFYRLIDVLWPQVPTPVAPGSKAPLSRGSVTSETNKVDNTTMETFQQLQNGCMSCHRNAHVATTQTCTAGECFASDYSFVFSTETRD